MEMTHHKETAKSMELNAFKAHETVFSAGRPAKNALRIPPSRHRSKKMQLCHLSGNH